MLFLGGLLLHFVVLAVELNHESILTVGLVDPLAQNVVVDLRVLDVSLGALAVEVLLQLYQKFLSVRSAVGGISGTDHLLDFVPILAVESQSLQKSIVLLIGPPAEDYLRALVVVGSFLSFWLTLV